MALLASDLSALRIKKWRIYVMAQLWRSQSHCIVPVANVTAPPY